MQNIFGRRILIICLLLLASTHVAQAERLQRLTVQRFTLTGDTARPIVEHPFHLVITIRVAQRVSELRNVVLPVLPGLEILGDEVQTSHPAQGTQYRETLAVLAHGSGDLHIGSAYIDAIDARDGAGKRYFSNALTLTVTGPTGEIASALRQRGPWLAILVRWITTILGLTGIGILVLVFVAARRRRPMPIQQPVSTTMLLPPARPIDPNAAIREALATLRASQTRVHALALRAQLRARLGIAVGATLADALSRRTAREPRARAALVAVEAAAFVHDAAFEGRVGTCINAVEAFLA